MILTPSEQRVYRYFYNKKVFTLDEANSFVKNYRTAIHVVRGLARKGYTQRVKGGLYHVIPFEKTPDQLNEFQPDKYLIASKFNGFISHRTALELYNAAEPVNKVFITSWQRLPNLKHKDVDYSCIKTKHYFGYKEINYEGHSIKVSDKERAILDCIRDLRSITIEELFNSITKLKSINFENLYLYLRKINEASLFARTGFVFDHLKHEVETPVWFLNKLKGNLSNKTYYLDPNKIGVSKHVKEWRLMVPT